MKYRLYPTLLNSFSLYLKDVVDYDSLMGQINRRPFEPTPEILAGIQFEKDVIEYAQTGIIKEHEHTPLIKKACAMTPSIFLTQFYVSTEIIPNVEFYGLCDIVGSGKIQDIKTTGYYDGSKYKLNHQSLYMLAMRKRGINISRMDYIVTDFQDVYLESYFWKSYFFDELIEELRLFVVFLEENKHLITDQKIFNYGNT